MSEPKETNGKKALVPQATNSLPAAVIQAQLYRDWKGTTEEQRVKACLELCHILGIPTPMNPFQFITMNNKLVLYAPNEAAQLIAESRRASVEVLNKYVDKERNIFVVEVQVSTPERRVQNFAAISLAGLTGQKLADAMMKCCTKAQRRTIFGAFGLSVSDEDDVQAVKDTVATTLIKPQTGIGNLENVEPDLREEVLDARTELLKRLTGERKMKAQAAIAWIQERAGKSLETLTAVECGDLHAALEDEDQAESQNSDLFDGEEKPKK